MTPDEEHRTSGPDEAEVQRLLAALGGESVPVPPEVAARLDATLVNLSAERDRTSVGEAAARPVTALPGRERPRRWPQLLVAAAAVSVLGLGMGEVLEGPSGSDSTTAATADRAEDAPADAAGQQDGGEAAPEPYAAQDSPETQAVEPPAGREELDRRTALNYPPIELSRLRSGSLTADVQRIADFTLTDTAVQGTPLDGARDGGGCERPDPGAGGELFAVRLDGDPATLLLHRAEDGRRLAEVFPCGDASAPVASTTVAAG